MSAGKSTSMDAGQALSALLQAGQPIRRASWTAGLTLRLRRGGPKQLLWAQNGIIFEICTSLGNADLGGTDWVVVP